MIRFSFQSSLRLSHQFMRRGAVPAAFALALCIATVAPAFAQTGEVVLEGIIIEGATLDDAAITVAQQGSTVSVVTGEQLRTQQIRHAGEALREVAGVHVNTSGGSGGLANIRIRGGEGNHVTVLLDGVEVNHVDFGAFDFSTLTANDIERIEVIRGPQSGIYGANALSGVVNVVTRKGAELPTIEASLEGGSFDTGNASGSFGAGDDDGYLNLSGARQQTDGHNVSRFGTEADGSQQNAFFARAGGRLSPFFRLDVMGRYHLNNAEIDSDTDFDGLLDDIENAYSERQQLLGRAVATLDLFDGAWQQKFAGDFLNDDLQNNGPFGLSNNDAARRHGSYETTFRLGDADPLGIQHFLTGLVEVEREEFNSTFSAGALSRGQVAYAGEYRGAYNDTFFLTGNVRHDDNDTFADFTTWKVAGAAKIHATGTRLHASTGIGIQNPTFFEQFGSIFGVFVGNASLQPEESSGWDVGVEQSFWDGRGLVDVTYFNNDLTGQIASAPANPLNPFGPRTAVNLPGESTREGIEVSLSLKPIAGLTIAGSYTYLETERPDRLVEVRRPMHSASLTTSYRFADERALLSVALIYNGEMEDDNFGTFPSSRVTLDEYVLVNLAGSYRLTDELELFGRVENLLDEGYEEVYGYRAKPLAAYAGVRIKLQSDVPLIESFK